MSKTILFFGNERLATGSTTKLPVLSGLRRAGYQIASVILAQSDQSPSRSAQALEIERYSAEHQLPVLKLSKLSDHIAELAAFKAEAAILVAYGQIVPRSVIGLFPSGIINLHPSLLPKHRGPTPIESAILSSETKTGVSLMQLTPKMDSGPIYAQATTELTGTESKQDLVDVLGQIGADLLLKHLPDILSGQAQPDAQDEAQATYDGLITKDDSQINWQQSAAAIARQVRAYAGWPKSRTGLKQTEVVLSQVEVIDRSGPPGEIWQDNQDFGFYAKDKAIKVIKLTPAGQPAMTARAYLAGHSL